MKFIFVLVLLACVSILPLLIERTNSPCVALERLAAHKLFEPKDPALKLEAQTEKRVRRYFREGHVAEVIVARNYAMKPAIGCPLMYWQGLFNPDSIREPVLSMQ